MEFKHHMGIFTADDRQAGRLDRVVINPKTSEVTHLVVHQGVLSATDKVIPIGLVEIGDEDSVVLRMTANEVARLPEFEEKRDAIAVKVGARVITRDGRHTGHIAEILTTANGDRVTHVLISKGVWHTEKKLIPVDWIDAVSEDKVHLMISTFTVDRLPEYEPAQAEGHIFD